MVEVVDLKLDFRSLSTRINPRGTCAHYAGGPQWPGADTSSAEAFRDSCDHNRCASKVRAYHDYHLSEGWSGLAYSAVCCPHGVVFLGRGKGKRTAAQGTNEGNTHFYAVCYIGGGDEPLTDEAKVAFVHAADVVLGQSLAVVHSDIKATSCPGHPIRNWRDGGWVVPGKAKPAKPPPKQSKEQKAHDAVVDAYQDILGRKPDRKGLKYWTSKLVSGEMSVKEMRKVIASSNEAKPDKPDRKGTFDMENIFLHNVTRDGSTWVRARDVPHVNQLQLNVAHVLALNRRPHGGLLNAKTGMPDGLAGPGTRKRLIEVQQLLLSQGRDIGSSKADGMCGPKTWEALIEYRK